MIHSFLPGLEELVLLLSIFLLRYLERFLRTLALSLEGERFEMTKYVLINFLSLDYRFSLKSSHHIVDRNDEFMMSFPLELHCNSRTPERRC
jgi:hypothetical protein